MADTQQTRSFLQTIPTSAETGWVGMSRTGAMPDSGARVAVFPGTSGLDRLALSRWLREQGLHAAPTRSPEQLANTLRSGETTAGITERFVAGDLQLDGFSLFWLPEQSFQRHRMAFGLWKGDQTLKRAVISSLEKLGNAGALTAIEERYGLARPIAAAQP